MILYGLLVSYFICHISNNLPDYSEEGMVFLPLSYIIYQILASFLILILFSLQNAQNKHIHIKKQVQKMEYLIIIVINFLKIQKGISTDYVLNRYNGQQNRVVETTAGAATKYAAACAYINIAVPPTGEGQITYTFKRTDIITDLEMGGNSATIGLVMNLGANFFNHNPITHVQDGSSTSTFTITKTATSLKIFTQKTI